MARKRNRKALKKDIFIAVMGPTGTGKSTFINLVTKSEKMGVGHGLESHTDQAQRSDPIKISGRRVILLDTPGFYDTNATEMDILRQIALALHTTYEQGFLLSGIVYMHSMKTAQMSGSRRKNLVMFRELCGTEALKNVAVVTNMWDAVDPVTGRQQERLLLEEPDCFKPFVDGKACVMRHNNTYDSAIAIVRRLIANDPLPLQIQQQLVEPDMGLIDTSAAKYLLGTDENDALQQQDERQNNEDREAMEAFELLDAGHDEHRSWVEEFGEKYATKIDAFEKERRRLAGQYAREKATADAQVATLKRLQEEDGELAQAIKRLTEQLAEGKRLDSEKRVQIEAEIRKLKEESSSRHAVLTVTFGVLAIVLDVALSTAVGAPFPLFSSMNKLVSGSGSGS